jgi:hypothetical protein
MNPSSAHPSAASGRFRAARTVRSVVFASAGVAALLSLSGCYYYPGDYPATYGYGSSPYYATAPAVVAAPAYSTYPAYPAYPAYYSAYPAYAYPSISLGFGGYWGGHHWRR